MRNDGNTPDGNPHTSTGITVIVPFSDTAIRNTKPEQNPVNLLDEKGLYLLMIPPGGKWWRFEMVLMLH